MIAVAILGLVASLTIPRYMEDVWAKRQAECPRELKKIVAAENEFFRLHKRYTADLRELNWMVPENARYLYGFRTTPPGQKRADPLSWAGNTTLNASDLPETSFSDTSYQIGCVGNIDTDQKLDRLIIDEKGNLTHIDNDIE